MPSFIAALMRRTARAKFGEPGRQSASVDPLTAHGTSPTVCNGPLNSSQRPNSMPRLQARCHVPSASYTISRRAKGGPFRHDASSPNSPSAPGCPSSR